MDNDERKLEGKLKTLVEAFAKANPDNTEELDSMIYFLEQFNWEVKAADIYVKIGASGPLLTWDDGDYFDEVWQKANKENPAAQLTDNEKLNRIVELSKSDVFNCDHNQVKLIAETLQLSNS